MSDKFLLTVPIYSANFSRDLKWYHKDSKRIMSKKVFNTRHIQYYGESYQIVGIDKRNKDMIFWLLDIQDNKDTSVRITPMYEVEILEKIETNNGVYFRVKRKEK